jgi:hypothetical protein
MQPVADLFFQLARIRSVENRRARAFTISGVGDECGVGEEVQVRGQV